MYIRVTSPASSTVAGRIVGGRSVACSCVNRIAADTPVLSAYMLEVAEAAKESSRTGHTAKWEGWGLPATGVEPLIHRSD
jgi:hypothetical protein